MDRSTEGGSTPDKCRICSGISGIVVSVTGQKIFVRGANTIMKMNVDIAGDSATGNNKFIARQWTVLIGFCCVETWNQVQNIWELIKKALDATEVRTIVVTPIKDQQVDVERQSSRV